MSISSSGNVGQMPPAVSNVATSKTASLNEQITNVLAEIMAIVAQAQAIALEMGVGVYFTANLVVKGHEGLHMPDATIDECVRQSVSHDFFNQSSNHHLINGFQRTNEPTNERTNEPPTNQPTANTQLL